MPESESEVRKAKHQRTEEPQITRSEVWHDDGSVVLQAENTQFRVHWSVLSLHSSFFREMRALPQPPDQPSVEGCPVIRLHDSSADVQYLLDALYNPLVFRDSSPPSLPFISGIIRIGRKYDFKSLFTAAVEHLTYENPTTLEEYERLRGGWGDGDSDSAAMYRPAKLSGFAGITSLFDIVTLARENQLLTVLPCAYLRAILLAANDPALILDGAPRSDGSSVKLSQEDLRTCILGSRKLMDAQWKQNDLWKWFSSDELADGCTDKLVCLSTKKAVFQVVLRKSICLVPYHPLFGFLCSACNHRHLEVMADGRKQLWAELPICFGLPPWEELKNEL
ncbi:hypothetical protein GGX14DRAFT_352018 [Mycena pura]|uniref:BTB domain-containing protein n=1 Tax=Mycena pura TaxID=153505 RepID=A0AAD7E0Q8_9AGAR|nr:hypothetical protein GGX14DRAFT_352018 [Mycena pura]